MDGKQNTGAGQVLGINRIKKLIPHRYPFLMIDRVIDVVYDVSATGIKNVTINEPYFQGHFPSRPIMPGVLIIEAMAQTAGVLVVASMGGSADGKLVYFMAIEAARFRKPVTPGDCVHIPVEKIQSRGNVWKFKGEALVDGKLMAEATYSAMIVEDEE